MWWTSVIEGLISDYQSSLLKVPTGIQLKNEALVWNPATTTFDKKPTSDELILEFAGLALVEADSVLEFACTWGVLELCEHGLPATHNPPSVIPPQESSNKYCEASGNEAIEIWHKAARMFRAILNIASRLHRSDKGNKADWQVLNISEDNIPKEISDEQALLVSKVNAILDVANVRPRLQWTPPQVQLAYPFSGSLFGILAIQLMQKVVASHGPQICSSCGSIYIVETFQRRPRVRERNYCYSCKLEGASKRDAVRDFRKRKQLKETK